MRPYAKVTDFTFLGPHFRSSWIYDKYSCCVQSIPTTYIVTSRNITWIWSLHISKDINNIRCNLDTNYIIFYFQRALGIRMEKKISNTLPRKRLWSTATGNVCSLLIHQRSSKSISSYNTVITRDTGINISSAPTLYSSIQLCTLHTYLWSYFLYLFMLYVIIKPSYLFDYCICVFKYSCRYDIVSILLSIIQSPENIQIRIFQMWDNPTWNP